MKRMKRVTSWMLVLCVMMTFLPAVVVADEAELVSIRVFNGNTESSYRVLFRNNDLYFPAEAFGKITRYLFTESENYGYQLGSKLIIVNPANGEIKIPVLHYTGNIGEVVTIDGTDYLSASQMLPWMNVTCSVEDGVLIVIPDKISLWQIVENFSYEHYMFNLYNEYGDSVSSVIGLSAMMVFDGIINFRYERLIPSDENSSLYDYECYVQALAEIGPNSVNEEGLRELRQYVDVNKGLDPIAEYLGVKLENGMNGLGEEEIQEILKISETWEEMRQCASIPGIITEYYDIFEAYKAYELIVGTDNEYREYLAWLSEQGTGNTTFDRALEEAQTLLDENKGVTYTLISGFTDQLLEDTFLVVPGEVFQAIANNAIDEATITKYAGLASGFEYVSSLKTYTEVSKLIFTFAFSEMVTGYEGIAKVAPLETIQDYCWLLAGTLRNEELTEDTIVHIRQSYLTALKTSKQLFEAKKNSMDFGFLTDLGWVEDYDELMDSKIDLIDMKIQQLIASADTTQNDSVEGKQEYVDKIKSMFADVEKKPDMTGQEERYLEFLHNHPEYNYYAFLDVNSDGVIEMLATEKLDDRNGVFLSTGEYVDLYISKDDVITLAYENIRSKYTYLAYDAVNQRIVSSIGGSDGAGVSYVFLDDLLMAHETSFEAYCHRIDENGEEVWERYYNGDVVSEATQRKYDELYDSWKKSSSEVIVFQAVPKAALIGKWRIYPTGIPHEKGYWVDVVINELCLDADGRASVALGVVAGEWYEGYSGTWSAVPESENEFTLQLKLKGGMMYYSDEGENEQKECELLLRVKLDGTCLLLEKISGDDICLYYSEAYECDLEFETWVERQGPVENHITYQTLLWQYPEYAEYTLHDIDKDGQDELIILEKSSYYVYTMIGKKVKLCGELYSNYAPYCLYAYDGNGVIVHDGGTGSLHLEYVALYSLSDGLLTEGQNLIDTEWHTLEELQSYLRQYTLIDNFVSVVDETLLEE